MIRDIRIIHKTIDSHHTHQLIAIKYHKILHIRMNRVVATEIMVIQFINIFPYPEYIVKFSSSFRFVLFARI